MDIYDNTHAALDAHAHGAVAASHEIIECLIDRLGTAGVLEAVATVMVAKADHVASNWQDERAARVWTQASARVASLSHTVRTQFPGLPIIE